MELRDGGDRYLGKGVLKAVANVNDLLGPAVKGMDVTDQDGIDKVMLDCAKKYCPDVKMNVEGQFSKHWKK